MKRGQFQHRARNRAKSERFDWMLMNRFENGKTMTELAALYCMPQSTIRDCIYNAQARAAAQTPTIAMRREQALAWKEAAILLETAMLATATRKEEMIALAKEQMKKAKKIDERIGQP
jgi:predicted Fe-S protein YdhL (DUF1289 family)